MEDDKKLERIRLLLWKMFKKCNQKVEKICPLLVWKMSNQKVEWMCPLLVGKWFEIKVYVH